MSVEVELERPLREEIRKRQPSRIEEEVELEKEEQCVCQICTCGNHRCQSFFLDRNGYHEEAAQIRELHERDAGRKQWEVSPDRVLQIARSYRSDHRQDDASETTVVSEQRMSRQEETSHIFHEERASDYQDASEQALKVRLLRAEGASPRLGPGGQGLLAAGVVTSRQGQTSDVLGLHEAEQETLAMGAIDGFEVKGKAAEVFPSRFRPRTSLRLEGAQEYVTTSSDYFSTAATKEVIDQTVAGGVRSGRTRPEDASGIKLQTTRPKTSLRMEGTSHFTTTTSDDFKRIEQAEKVTRRLRPRKFDDPAYDAHAAEFEVEGDVKKRRTEGDAADVAETSVAEHFERQETRVAQETSDLRLKGDRKSAVEVVPQEPPDVQEEAEPETGVTFVKTPKDKRKPGDTKLSKELKQKVDQGSSTAELEAYFRPEVPTPFYPQNNLKTPSEKMDLRTTHEMDYYKKKMERVRPVKPKSLSKLFESSSGCSSTEADVRTGALRRGKQSRIGKSTGYDAEAVKVMHAAGVSSGLKEAGIDAGNDNVLLKQRLKTRKKQFPQQAIKWEGTVNYTTTNSDAYKNYEMKHATRRRLAAQKKPKSHDVFQRYTMTEDELQRIKSGAKHRDDISMFGRKDSTELIAEIQDLLSPRGKRKTEKRADKPDTKAQRQVDGLETSEKVAYGHGEEGRFSGSLSRSQEEQVLKERSHELVSEEHFGDTHVSRRSAEYLAETRHQQKQPQQVRLPSVVDEKTGSRISKQKETKFRGATKESVDSQVVVSQSKADARMVEAAVVLSPEARRLHQKEIDCFKAEISKKKVEKELAARPESPFHIEHGRGGHDFSTTTAEAFKEVPEDMLKQRTPYYPKSNLTSEGDMMFGTVNQAEYVAKTVTEIPTPVRPVSTLKLSDDNSFAARNEDKIGFSSEELRAGETRRPFKRPESTIVLGNDSTDYKTTSQTEYKNWENRQRYIERAEENYSKVSKAKRDRNKTYTRTKAAQTLSKPDARQYRQYGLGDVSTTTQAAFKPVSVERPQPFRPRTCLKVRNESYATEMSTTTRETYKRVMPTARVKPIKRETCLRKLGDDTDPVPKTTTSGEAYVEVKIPPKSEPYRPTDNLKVTGGMTFSTTSQETYLSHAAQKNVEIVERTVPIKRDAVVKDIIFPATDTIDSSFSPVGQGFRRRDESTEVLRSVENVRDQDSYARLRKESRERSQANQRGEWGAGGMFHETGTSTTMGACHDAVGHISRISRAGARSKTPKDSCPAAFLNTEHSEYIFKEVIGKHKFYLPAVQ